jgi:hypothetical protein
MAWHEENPRHTRVRGWLFMVWIALALIPALWAASRAVNYFDIPGLSLVAGAVAFAVVFYLGKAIIRP